MPLVSVLGTFLKRSATGKNDFHFQNKLSVNRISWQDLPAVEEAEVRLMISEGLQHPLRVPLLDLAALWQMRLSVY